VAWIEKLVHDYRVHVLLKLLNIVKGGLLLKIGVHTHIHLYFIVTKYLMPL